MLVRLDEDNKVSVLSNTVTSWKSGNGARTTVERDDRLSFYSFVAVQALSSRPRQTYNAVGPAWTGALISERVLLAEILLQRLSEETADAR
jgi:hypothetical protein